jgi:hypothetical protein
MANVWMVRVAQCDLNAMPYSSKAMTNALARSGVLTGRHFDIFRA